MSVKVCAMKPANTAAMPLAPDVEKPVVGATGDKIAFASFA